MGVCPTPPCLWSRDTSVSGCEMQRYLILYFILMRNGSSRALQNAEMVFSEHKYHLKWYFKW